MQVLPRERRDVGVHVIGGPVGNARAYRYRFETIAEGCDVRGNVSALAPAHCAHAVLVDKAFRDQRIHSRNHIGIITDAQVPHVQRAEFLAITRRAAVVRAQHQSSLGHQPLHGIVAVGVHHRLIHARGPAVNHYQQRIFFLGIEIRRRIKHALDRRAVPGLPGKHFAVGERESLELLAHRRQLLALPGRYAGGVDLRVLVVERCPVSHRFVIARKRKARCRHLVGGAQLLHRAIGGIQAKQMRRGFLQGAKINSIRPPGD